MQLHMPVIMLLYGRKYSATASSAPQLLTRLKCPATSELVRNRKVATNPPAPPTGRN